MERHKEMARNLRQQEPGRECRHADATSNSQIAQDSRSHQNQTRSSNIEDAVPLGTIGDWKPVGAEAVALVRSLLRRSSVSCIQERGQA